MSRVDLVILGLLLEKPRHGYDIIQTIEKREMKQWVGISTPAIYKGLSRLEAKRVLRAHHEPGTSHPDRTVYEITSEGRDRFQRLMAEALVEPKKPFFDLLTGVGFAHLVGKADLLAYVESRVEKLQPLRDMLVTHFDEIAAKTSVTLSAEFVIKYYLRLIEMELDWLAELSARVKKLRRWPEGVCKDES